MPWRGPSGLLCRESSRHFFFFLQLCYERGSLIRPSPEAGPYRVAGADGGEQHQVAFLEAALADGVARSQRNGGGGGVAVPLDIDRDLLGRDAETLTGALDDAQVGLVRNQRCHVRH